MGVACLLGGVLALSGLFRADVSLPWATTTGVLALIHRRSSVRPCTGNNHRGADLQRLACPQLMIEEGRGRGRARGGRRPNPLSAAPKDALDFNRVRNKRTARTLESRAAAGGAHHCVPNSDSWGKSQGPLSGAASAFAVRTSGLYTAA